MARDETLILTRSRIVLGIIGHQPIPPNNLPGGSGIYIARATGWQPVLPAEPLAVKVVPFFRAVRESSAVVLVFCGWREAVQSFFAFVASNSDLPPCREH